MHDPSEKSILTPFLTCYEELSRFLTKKLGCREMAADVVQETYLRVARVDPARDISHPRAFLYRIAVNLAADAMRRRQVRARYESPEVSAEDVPSSAPSMEAALDARQQYRLLRQAVTLLPPKCRTVFLLHKAEQLSYAQIAARLHISTSAVEKHMSKALAHCRDYVKEGGR